jgi:NADH-quinone oxidoreductase subunit E
MSADELESIATFYNLIYRRPVGDQVILLCNSITCWIKGCDKLQQKITEHLGVGLGETTSDNRYTLLPVTCLGACDKAPVLMVGEDLHEDVTEQSLVRLLGSSGEAEQ